jgi:SAM-dependent methyltransferase
MDHDSKTAHALAENLIGWDERAHLHVDSYGAEAFADDPDAVELVVARSMELMRPHLPGGSLAGLEVVHLQCHIGNDSISLARLGADVTGVDFSGEAVGIGTKLAARAGMSERVRFVRSAVETAPMTIGPKRFDVVYTSVGVLGWLPDLTGWADAIGALLKPGGLFFIFEDHPVLHALDWDSSGGRFIDAYPYFHNAEPQTWDEADDYSSSAQRKHTRSHEWAHPISEIITVLLGAGLRIESFGEHRTMFWKPFDALVATETPGEWALRDHSDRIPLMFSLAARKPKEGNVND